MKPKTILITLSTLFLLLFVVGCDDKKEKPEEMPKCGCKSQTTVRFENEINTIYYKHDIYNDDLYPNHFWIGEKGHAIYRLIVCNENMLPTQVLKLRYDSASNKSRIRIKFSGNAKNICKSVFTLGFPVYYRIELTSIEVL